MRTLFGSKPRLFGKPAPILGNMTGELTDLWTRSEQVVGLTGVGISTGSGNLSRTLRQVRLGD